MLLVLGFVAFCVGGTLFLKGEVDRSPGAIVAVSTGAHALSVAGITLMGGGGLLMMGAVF